MIQKQTNIFFSFFSSKCKEYISLVKKEKTRLKLRKRGSFISSSWVSLALRPHLEKDHIKAFLSAPLMAAVITGGVVALPQQDVSLSSWDISQPVTSILGYQTVTPVGSEFPYPALPVTELLGISQSYHPGHPGIDLRAPLNSSVVSIDEGHVSLVEQSSLGYGHRVIITHDNNIQTMYAHLGQIDARVGEYVARGESVGQVGMTGMTTGPHLHFELHQDSTTLNPISYLAPAIETYQQATSPDITE
jgi:murein DD-endopeptidase MepM/ murein hydrolase activator NlpD